jgi:hypothetical protein
MSQLISAPQYMTPGTPVNFSMNNAPLIVYVVLYPASGDSMKLEQSRDGGIFWETVLSNVTAKATGQRFDGGCPLIRVSGSNAASYFTVC